MKHLFLLGVSHHTAPVDLRERIDFSRRGLPEALAMLVARPSPSEAVVLSTCNRAELYVRCQDPETARADLVEFLIEFHAIEADAVVPHLYARTGIDVARHLFRVAAGLDSLVVGEPQILGQVKEAFATATQQRTTGSLLNKLFHASFAAGKRVRTETELGEGAVSVSYAAVALARKIFGKMDTLRVLIIGAGEMAELTAVHLQAQHVRDIAVTSRTPARADGLALKVGGHALPWSDLPSVLGSVDIVVTATGSTEPIVTTSGIDAVMRARRNRPLFILDIAVPRDVEPSAGAIEQVFLYNIDDLRTLVSENLARRKGQVEHAERIVEEEVAVFMAWLRSRGAVPTVIALRQRFETIRQAELKRLESKLASLPPAGRARVEEITHLIIEKLLLAPTEQLKMLSDQETLAAYSDALGQLFELELADSNPRDDAQQDDAAPTPPKTPVTS